MDSLEEVIKDAVKKDLTRKAEEIIDNLVEDFRKQLNDEAAETIAQTVSSLVYRERQSMESLGTDIILSIRK